MVRTAREILKPVLACKNGSTAPEIYAVSHSHLDLEWLWTREETRRKVARTMGNQLRLLEEYPEQKYIQSQAWILNTIKNEYPDLYEEVKQAVRDGKIIPDGAAWVEFDANISSGESIIRQFMFGKNFFRDEFGVESEMFWLPDSFGVSGALPQIMKKCGIKYFVNCKLKWLYNEADVFPHSSFIWKGIDGTEILSYMGTGRFCGYQNTMLPGDVNAIWEKNEDKEELPYQMMAYGFGDGGGGATRKQYEMFKREENLEGMPKVTIASPVDFFEKVEKECNVNTTFADELYYPCHRGVYTSQAKTKDLNRRNELALREAEMWSALLDADIKSETDELWKVLLFDQFHDILPGSAIRSVYEVVEAELGESLKRAKEITAEVLSGSTDKEKNTITVANSLSWERSSLVPLPEGFTSIKDTEGNLVDTQSIDDSVYACVSVPSCGYKSFVLGNDEITASIEEVSSHTLENDLIKAEFNKKGEIISVIDKESGVEFLASASNKFRMYQDLPTYSDAWDIDSFYEDLEVDMGNDVKLSNVVCGKLLSYFDVTKKVGKSCIKQRISLKKDSKSIIFETEVDWRESHKLLKVDFDTNIQTDHLISEVQYGYINRSNHKNRQYDKDRFEVCQLKWSALTEENRGAAILNDNKYGISSDNGKMSLTLLKSPEHPARDADKGIQNFTYAFMPYEGSFFDSGVVTSGYELNCPVVVTKGKTEEKSYFAIDKSNVIIDAIKIAEDNSGDVIVRMYESKKSATNCRVDFGFEVKKAYITNMLEENEEEIEVCNNSISLKFKAFEVVTVRLKK